MGKTERIRVPGEGRERLESPPKSHINRSI